MPVYKVWNLDRSKRKAVAADNLKDILSKGGKKLDLSREATRLVYECDGTEVDDDDVLLTLDTSVPLIILDEGETWCLADEIHLCEPFAPPSTPAATISVPMVSVQETTKASTSSEPVVSTQTTKAATLSEPMVSTKETTKEVSHTHGQSEKSHLSRAKGREDLLELPKFSYHTEEMLNGSMKATVGDWGNIISEAANFYFFKYPSSMDTSAEYQTVGQMMYIKYNSIGREGSRPWSLFTSALSARIRHLRWNEQRKTPAANSQKKARDGAHFKSGNYSSPSVTTAFLSDEDYDRHMEELRKEWRKKQPNKAHIKTILKETFKNSQKMIKGEEDGKIAPILKAIPCYQDAQYLLYDFHTLLGQEKWTKLKQLLPDFIESVRALMTEEAVEECDNVSQMIWFIEKKTCYKGKVNSILTEEKINGEEVNEILETAEKEAPRIVILINEETKARSGFVVGDGIVIDCSSCSNSGDSSVALLVLMGVYYVMDLEYPRVYSQVLGILQTYWLQSVPYAGQKSTKYRHFASLLKKQLSD